RWHGMAYPNGEQGVNIPENEVSSETDSEHGRAPVQKQRGAVKKLKQALGKLVSPFHQNLQEDQGNKTTYTENTQKKCSNAVNVPAQCCMFWSALQMKIVIEILFPLFTEFVTAAIHVDVVDTEMEKFIGCKVILRSRRISRRVSVTSLPARCQKVPYRRKGECLSFFKKRRRNPVKKNRKQSILTIGKFQTQVDDLIGTMADKSVMLLAQRHAELEQCECLGDEILQSSKQFERVSKKGAQQRKWKNLRLLCSCCC
ncbi:CC049 protein, partial [Atractosteus spatula]|nr:CC049 protein [Atractosteus spatula]